MMMTYDQYGRAATLCVSTLLGDPQVRNATKYLSPETVVRVARRHRECSNARRVEFVVTVGEPNYEASRFIKQLRKAGKRFPVRKLQLKLYQPVRRSK
jgi:hypothetical protein